MFILSLLFRWAKGKRANPEFPSFSCQSVISRPSPPAARLAKHAVSVILISSKASPDLQVSFLH
jgi:hypothetical protein